MAFSLCRPEPFIHHFWEVYRSIVFYVDVAFLRRLLHLLESLDRHRLDQESFTEGASDCS